MKLLFDQNLSPLLCNRLHDIYPGSTHVSWVGMDRADDGTVWDYARMNEFSLVTKDADFSELSTLRGFPPKVIWLQIGNCTTAEVEVLIRRNVESIQHLAESDGIGILCLRRSTFT